MERPSARVVALSLVGVALASIVFFVALEAWQTAESENADSSVSSAGSTDPSGAPDGGDASPQTPAAPGASLQILTSPPERSLWALPADVHREDLEITVEFEPYGIGPSSYGPSVVARVITAKPVDQAADVPDLTDRNVVFVLGESVVEKGGRYAATAVTQRFDDRIVFVLKDVRPAP